MRPSPRDLQILSRRWLLFPRRRGRLIIISRRMVTLRRLGMRLSPRSLRGMCRTKRLTDLLKIYESRRFVIPCGDPNSAGGCKIKG